jgi:hypothetical protein
VEQFCNYLEDIAAIQNTGLANTIIIQVNEYRGSGKNLVSWKYGGIFAESRNTRLYFYFLQKYFHTAVQKEMI